MAFIVETGEGLENANSFISTDFADEYFEDRGDSTWAATDYSDKEVALIRATDYINLSYDFVGSVSTTTQALEWPRDDAYDINGRSLEDIPTVLKKATAELALQVLSDDELISNYDNTGRVIRERVEGTVEVEYSDEGYLGSKAFVYVDRLLLNFGLAKAKRTSEGQVKVIRT